MKGKYEKIRNIEEAEELKYLGLIVQAKSKMFEGQKKEIMKENQRIEHDDKLCHRKSCHRVMTGSTSEPPSEGAFSLFFLFIIQRIIQ